MPGRPVLTSAEAESLALSLFGITGCATPLPGDSDANFQVLVDGEARYVLKIFNSTQNRSHLKAQKSALERARKDGLPVPDMLPPLDGDRGVYAKSDGESHVVRMVTYLPGVPLAGVDPVTDELIGELGSLLGSLDAALSELAVLTDIPDYTWDLRSAGDTIDARREWIRNAEDRNAVDRVWTRLNGESKRFDGLPVQLIHADANDYNVLVGPPTEVPRRISGLIDFGDLMVSWRVAEVAVACTYAMMNRDDPLRTACHLISGYNARTRLTDPELDVVFILILARLATSLCMSAFQSSLEPESEYLTISEEPARDLLHHLLELNPDLVTASFRDAVDREPFPVSTALRDWLTRNKHELHPVVSPDPRTSPPLVFDFSVESTAWTPEDLMHPLVAGGRIASFLAYESVPDSTSALRRRLGVGRYNEARLVYTGDQYATGGYDHAERRTIHAGMDLFAPPGSVVHAPLAGAVHSVADHNQAFDYGPTVIMRHEPGDGPVFYTLYGHLDRDSVFALSVGQIVSAGEAFARIGDDSVNGGWVPHVHFQVMVSLLDFTDTFPGVTAPSSRTVWLSLCPDPNLIIGVPADCFPEMNLTSKEILDLRSRYTGASLSLSYDSPLHIVRGYMQHLYDSSGRSWLDAVNNVAHVGHSNPRVVAAAASQAAALNTNTRYLHENLVRYAARLSDLAPDPLEVVFLVNSGSEANDLALRLAATHTSRSEILVVDGAYHGNLSSLIDISPYKYDGPGGVGPGAVTRAVEMPDAYRGPHKGYGREAGLAYAESVRNALSDNTSAFMVESILGCGGQVVLPDGYLETVFSSVREAGAVCICDEVQVGLGRVGSHFWGFGLQGVVPDIVTLGKPIGNGHPLGAVITTREIADSFANGMEYFNTFGGNPVSCATGMAVLDEMEYNHLQENTRNVGRHLLSGLMGLIRRHPVIGDVRGKGLFLGIELVRDRETLDPAPTEASYVVNRACELGILLSTDGPLHNVIKIKPPLVFSIENADRLIRTLDRILREDFVRAHVT